MTSYTTLLLCRIQMRLLEGSLSRFCQGVYGHLALAQGSWHLIGPYRTLQRTYRIGGNNRLSYRALQNRVKSQTLPYRALLYSLLIGASPISQQSRVPPILPLIPLGSRQRRSLKLVVYQVLDFLFLGQFNFSILVYYPLF